MIINLQKERIELYLLKFKSKLFCIVKHRKSNRYGVYLGSRGSYINNFTNLMKSEKKEDFKSNL